MTEGTKSYLIGCHQFFLHPLWVLIAWVKIYRRWPKFWELCCIFLHDIGHIGKNYLSDPKQKEEHWILGAELAQKFFGDKGFYMIAGHVTHSGFPRSTLYLPDKQSWIEAPIWWLTTNRWFENFGAWHSRNPHEFKKIIAENIANGCPKGSHEIYLELRDET